MKNLLILYIMFGFLFPSTVVGQTFRVKKEWIKKDVANFYNLISYLKSDTLIVAEIEAKIDALNIRNEREIWKNSKRIEAEQYGGYLTNRISLCALGGEIFSLKVWFLIDELAVLTQITDNNEDIKKELEQNWKRIEIISHDKQKYYRYEYSYKDNDVQSKFENEIESYFGRLANVQVEGRLTDYYNLLIDPIYSYDYGEYCYYGGTPPAGRRAIEKLIKENRVDLIKNIVRGYNPEGRAYGIEALLRIESSGNSQIINKEDQEVIDQLLGMNIPLRACEGCMVKPTNYREIFMIIKCR